MSEPIVETSSPLTRKTRWAFEGAPNTVPSSQTTPPCHFQPPSSSSPMHVTTGSSGSEVSIFKTLLAQAGMPYTASPDRRPPYHFHFPVHAGPTKSMRSGSKRILKTRVADWGMQYTAPSEPVTPPCHNHSPGNSGPTSEISGGTSRSAEGKILNTRFAWHGIPYSAPSGPSAARSHLYLPSNEGPASDTSFVRGSILNTRFACPGIA
mmetsp:Transcript_5605/g.17718  ORF Transcript_5605/g.17718 Transcript_5605/m.17718 type:complete len:208 (-) Transcript_5605:305-928(-)